MSGQSVPLIAAFREVVESVKNYGFALGRDGDLRDIDAPRVHRQPADPLSIKLMREAEAMVAEFERQLALVKPHDETACTDDGCPCRLTKNEYAELRDARSSLHRIKEVLDDFSRAAVYRTAAEPSSAAPDHSHRVFYQGFADGYQSSSEKKINNIAPDGYFVSPFRSATEEDIKKHQAAQVEALRSMTPGASEPIDTPQSIRHVLFTYENFAKHMGHPDHAEVLHRLADSLEAPSKLIAKLNKQIEEMRQALLNKQIEEMRQALAQQGSHFHKVALMLRQLPHDAANVLRSYADDERLLNMHRAVFRIVADALGSS